MVSIKGYFYTLMVFLCAAVFLSHGASAELDCTVCSAGSCSFQPSYVNIFNISEDGMIWTYNPFVLPGGKGVWCNESKGVLVGVPNGVPILRIDSMNDAHAERTDYPNYIYNINISSSNIRVQIDCDYRSSCVSFDACVISMESGTNSHVGDCSEHSLLLCCNATYLIITPRFLERKVFLSMGETYHVALQVSNPNPFEDMMILRLQGSYPQGLATFLPSSTGVLAPDEREMNITLRGFEKKILYIKLVSTGVGDYTLGVLAILPSDPTMTKTDSVDITIGFQANFPGMEAASILAVVILSGIIYWKKSRNGRL